MMPPARPQGAGVIHNGRNGRASSGRAHDESCVFARARGAGKEGRKGVGGQVAARNLCESRGPAVEPRGDINLLVADCLGQRAQVQIEIEIHRGRDVRRRRCFDETAQVYGAVDDDAPNRHCL